jgi:endonuclease I
MRQYLLFICLSGFLQASGQAPAGYYDAAAHLDGQPLRIALFHIIKAHNAQSYSALWSAFETTDKKANGKVWDIYSDIPGSLPPYEYTFGTDQCGSGGYNSEGDCYNREHSWPRSYFNEQAPMNADLFHIYPTDGMVNGKRDNDPYGLVDTTLTFWESENGSRSGTNRFPGYSGRVFEPVDSFKGDLARTYFYMSTRYYSEDNGWQNWPMANGANLTPWAAAMLLEWHHLDPVSRKETDRNNAVFALQNNRNPFIDHPEFADCIWGNSSCATVAVSPTISRNQVKVYPNPATDQVIIEQPGLLSTGTASLDVLNIQGHLLLHKQLTNKQYRITVGLSELSKGMYWIRLTSAQGTGYSKLVIR